MRVYVPATFDTLRYLRDRRRLDPPVTARAVTADVRWLHPDDQELQEDAVLAAAALDSLRLLADDPAPRRRVVVVAEVPDSAVVSGFGSSVRVDAPVPLARIRALMVDAVDAEPSAAGGPLGDDPVPADPAEGRGSGGWPDEVSLLWFAAQELDDLLE